MTISTEELRKLLDETTPGPWMLGQYSDTMGYDCMTGGVRVGPVVLDGVDYGQKPCVDLHIDDHFRMMADAHAIAAWRDLAAELITARSKLEAADDLYAALDLFVHEYTEMVNSGDAGHWDPEEEHKVIVARAALAKARGQA